MTREIPIGALAFLLATANLAPLLLPAKPGGVIAVVALLGALWLFQRAGALRARFLISLIGAALVAVLFGYLRQEFV